MPEADSTVMCVVSPRVLITALWALELVERLEGALSRFARPPEGALPWQARSGIRRALAEAAPRGGEDL